MAKKLMEGIRRKYMSVQPPSTDHTSIQPHSPHLAYGTTTVVRTSVLAWVGLGFAVVGAFVTAVQLMIVVRETSAQTRFAWVGALGHLLLPVLGIVLAVIGWRRHAKRWPVVAVAIAMLSILTLLLLSSRTWGQSLPGGQSPWHWPTFE